MWAAHLVLFAGVLSAIALVAPAPSWPTDRDTYNRIGRELIVPGCSELHCFRVLVPWLLGLLPGTILKWKIFAALCQAAAAVAMGCLASRFGLSLRTSLMVAWMTALGQGSLYTLFDPHTSDPLVHLLVPATSVLLFDGRTALAGVLAAAGIFAKEFAAVPLWVFAVGYLLQDRRREALQIGITAVAVTALWTAWQVFLHFAYGYSYGGSHAVDLLGGSFVVFWLESLGLRLVVLSIFLVYGAVYLLWPFGIAWGRDDLRRLTFAAAPMVLIFAALQQPDRGLWNFAFLILPAAGMVLDRAPAAFGWVFVAAFAVANLRYGAQLPIASLARVSILLSVVLAIACVWLARGRSAYGEVTA